jgi:diguanylate cyclase (GGDEF)-like protein
MEVPRFFAEVPKLADEHVLEDGEVLWREGDPGDRVVFLIEGTLAITRETRDGDVVKLRSLDAGAVVGEIAAFDGRTRSATVRAETRCRIVSMPAPAFRHLLQQRPDILEELYWLQVGRVRSLTSQVMRTHDRAITDPLTRLYNFGFFRERLSIELERARVTGDVVSLAIFDIDHFKSYNDTHGHLEGNSVLVTVADILKGRGRRGDIIVRYGGEEFVALLYGATRDEAARFAEGVRHGIESHAFPGGDTQPLGRLTLSAGVATFPLDATSGEDLITAADRNLYRAKAAGRNTVASEPRP